MKNMFGNWDWKGFLLGLLIAVAAFAIFRFLGIKNYVFYVVMFLFVMLLSLGHLLRDELRRRKDDAE